MKVLLLAILVILAYIAHRINNFIYMMREYEEMHKTGHNPVESPNTSNWHTTSYPLFTQFDIEQAIERLEDSEEKVEHHVKSLKKQEENEIRDYLLKHKDISLFEPSTGLKGIIKDLSSSVSRRNNAKARLRGMLEANISIQNGKKISLAEEEFDKTDPGLISFDLDDDEYNKVLAECREYWRTSSEAILERGNKSGSI